MPTVVIGNNTGDDYSGTEDTLIKQASAENNYGSKDNFEITKYNTNDYSHSLIKFSGISSLPSDITISASTMYLYCSTHASGTRTATAKRLLRDWIEGSLNGSNRSGNSPYSSCWNEYGSGNTWTSSGAISDGNDRSGTDSGIMDLDGTGYKSVSDNQLNLDVENITNGTYNNYGWHFEVTGTPATYTYDVFTSSEGSDGQRPYLSVTYTESGSVVPRIMQAMNQFNGGL